MNDLDITELDPFDDGVFAAWHAAYATAVEAAVGAAEAQVYSVDNARVQWQEPTSDQVRRGFVGRVGDGVVAAGVLALPQLENLGSAFVAVAPAHQHRGHGRACSSTSRRRPPPRGARCSAPRSDSAPSTAPTATSTAGRATSASRRRRDTGSG